MNEILFLVEDAIEGGYTARALGESIFTEGDILDELRVNIRDAVDCHFDEDEKPKMIRLHLVSQEVMAARKCLLMFPGQTLSRLFENLVTQYGNSRAATSG